MSSGEPSSQNLTEGDDWPLRAANTIVGYVDKTKQATTGKVLVLSRAAVYLTAAALLSIIIAIIALIATVRLLVSLTSQFVPFIGPGEVWLSYYIVAFVFFVLTWILWRKRGR